MIYNKIYLVNTIAFCTLTALLLIPNPVFAQINNIQFDLSNEYINRVYSDKINPQKDIYRQNYLIRTDGYLYHPNLLTFNIKSDLYILSDSQITESTEKSLDTKNFGYYDFSIMLFPKQNTNIKIFSLEKKTDRNEEVMDISDSIVPKTYFSETTINRTGFTIKRSSQNNLPGIILTASRLSVKDSTMTVWLKNVIDIKVFNKNPKDNASYSLNYRAYDQESNFGNINDIKYDFNLLANAELTEKSKLTIRGNFIKYDASESLIGDFRHYYNPSKMLYNDFSIRANQFKYSSGENISYRILNRIRLDKHKNYKIRLTANYNNRIILRSIGNTYSKSGYIKPELIFNKRNKYFHWNGFVHYNFGIINDQRERGYTHSTNGNLRLSTVKFKRFKLSLTENIGYSTFLNNLKMVRTKSGAELLLNLTYRFTTGGFITWDRSKYLSQGANEYSRILFKGIINSQPTNNMRIKYEHQYSYNYSNYSNNIQRSRITISESGIIKNAVFHITAERISMSDNYTRDNLNASISYRIFNFTITGGYWVNYSNDLRFDEIRIMVRRPIGINL